ncbi:uncharacterized protein LOC143290202 [Babylonia areolata]|uniref:uncharacterized protein LOC143290202 n=1 Tax=Babylonia areolata TaxID=304850 RepID=UPI003FCFEAF9
MKGLWPGGVCLWLVCVLTSSSCAVFYTHGQDNNYPRIGRRAFFTRGDQGSRYPRIGRSSPGPEASHAISGSENGFRSAGGRSEFGQQKKLNDLQLSDPSVSDALTSMEEPEVTDSDEPFRLPLGLLFYAFDKNGDKTLTREEFVQGMITVEMGTTELRR